MRKNRVCRLTSSIALASSLLSSGIHPKAALKEMFCMTDYRVRAGDIEEDQVTSLIESYSAQLPSSFYLGAAGASILASLIAKLQGKDHAALFFGQWAAPFLLLGIYNKMVKQHGSDAIYPNPEND
jgi:hypothetical protein